LEAVDALQKTAKLPRRLGRHQLDPPRQGDHLKGLPGTEAELLSDPLGNHDQELGGDGRDIRGKNDIRNLMDPNSFCELLG